MSSRNIEKRYNSNLFSEQTINMQMTYWKLGENKWKEGIDGIVHSYGKYVYDFGLHNNGAEPGFLTSLNKGFKFIDSNLNQRTTKEMYLNCHNTVCSHFQGKKNNTNLHVIETGQFRDIGDPIYACFSNLPNGFSREVAIELNLFDSRIGYFTMCDNKIKLNYPPLSKKIIESIFERTLKEYYTEIDIAKNEIEKIQAIGKFTRHCEWIHPFKDGVGRTDTLFLNKHLTENGFHPVLLDDPCLSSVLSFDEWISYLKQGLLDWEKGLVE